MVDVLLDTILELWSQDVGTLTCFGLERLFEGKGFLINVFATGIMKVLFDMWLVVLKADGKALVDILLLIKIIEYDFSFLIKSFNIKLGSLLWLSLKQCLTLIIGFLNFHKSNLIWFQISIDIEFIVANLSKGIVEVCLFKDVLGDVNEGAISPDFGGIRLEWETDSRVLLVGFVRLVVDDHDELFQVTVLLKVDGAVEDCVILGQVGAGLDALIQRDSCLLDQNFFKLLLVN